MKYLITGADGFIGKNLASKLTELPGAEILKFRRSDSQKNLSELINQADCIFHLAGENRPAYPGLFYEANVLLTSRICAILKEKNLQIPIIFGSSTQADSNSDYGVSKKDAEIVLKNYIEESGGSLTIYRFPGIFGKWCRPNYNSVVATYCHNIANGLPISISDHNKLLKLIYIDDVVKDLIFAANRKFNGVEYRTISPEYEIKLGELADQIYRFKNMRKNLFVETVGGGIIGALYSTYLSYCPKDEFSYHIPSYLDDRGVFVEMFKTSEHGQMSYFTANPGVTRGSHYHHSKTEKFLVVQGCAQFRFRNVLNNELHEFSVNASDFKVIDSIPGWVHSVTNTGSEVLIVMLWANEIFDPHHPDTIKCEI